MPFTPEELEALRKSIELRQKAEIATIKKNAADEAEKATKAKQEKAIAEAIKKARAEERAKISRIEQEAAEAIERAHKLEKELALAGNKDTTAVSLLFEQMRNLINEVCERIAKVDGADNVTASKLRRAFNQLLDLAKETIGGDT